MQDRLQPDSPKIYNHIIEFTDTKNDSKSENQTIILNEADYNVLLENKNRIKQLTESQSAAQKQIVDLQMQLQETIKQKENADFKVRKATGNCEHLENELKKTLEEKTKLQAENTKLTKTITKWQTKKPEMHNKPFPDPSQNEVKDSKNAINAIEAEKNEMQKYLKQQLSFLQNELYRKQQELNDTVDLLKQKEIELDETRQETVTLNESFLLEQQSHKDTCDKLSSVSMAYTDRLQKQAEYYENKLYKAQSEINRLQNLHKNQEKGKLYSTVVKRSLPNLFKENKIGNENESNRNNNTVNTMKNIRT